MESLEVVRGLVAAGRPTAWSRGYPPAVRERVAAYVLARRSRGDQPSRIASDLGISRHSVIAWAKGRPSEPATPRLVPVVLDVGDTLPDPATAEAIVPATTATASSTPLTLVSPRGFRLEGLTVDAAAELLGRLG